MAHECINCASDCYCGGDIDDHHTGDNSCCHGCGCDEDGLNEPDDSDEYVSVFGHPESATWVCRQCGCHNEMACVHPKFGPCFWLEPNLCSHCVELKDDPAVLRPWQTSNTLNAA